MYGISSFIKETPKIFHDPSPFEDMEKTVNYVPSSEMSPDTEMANTLTLDFFLNFQNYEK